MYSCFMYFQSYTTLLDNAFLQFSLPSSVNLVMLKIFIKLCCSPLPNIQVFLLEKPLPKLLGNNAIGLYFHRQFSILHFPIY